MDRIYLRQLIANKPYLHSLTLRIPATKFTHFLQMYLLLSVQLFTETVTHLFQWATTLLQIFWHRYYVPDHEIHSLMLVRCASGQFLCQNKLWFLLTVKMFLKTQESTNTLCRYCYPLSLNETWRLLAGGLMCREGCKSQIFLTGCYKTLRCVWDGL